MSITPETIQGLLDELEASRQAGGPHWREATDALGFVGRVGSGNGTLRTLRRSKNHPTKIKRSRTRLQLVLGENCYWRPAALCWRFSIPHEMRSHSVPRGDSAPERT